MLSLAGLACSNGTAWAVSPSPALRGEAAAASAAAEEAAAAPKLPVIGNATDLDREPVVHATKGKPPDVLEVKNLVLGTGAAVTSSSTVEVVYVGADYSTGKDFTQVTWTDHRTLSFSLGDVVRGFAQGLIGMKVGGRREIVIPPKLGYGDHSYGTIKANETLVFVVDLKGVKK